MNRGSLNWIGTSKCPTNGFNEAPIHESGKSAIYASERTFVRTLQ